MASPWATISQPSTNFAEIMSEEYAQKLQEELTTPQRRVEAPNKTEHATYSQAAQIAGQADAPAKANNNVGDEWEDYSHLLDNVHIDAVKSIEEEEQTIVGTSPQSTTTDDELTDVVIAQLLQSQFDHEYNEELRRIEKQRNQKSKITVTLDKFRRNGDLEFLHELDDDLEEEDEEESLKRDWDRFETNEKILDTIPKCGFKLDKEGEMITKHDDNLCGVRNACRVMSFPPDFPTGDGAGFDMKLSNKVFNQLKTYSRRSGNNKKNKMQDRKEYIATAEMGLDGPTCLLLYKMINNQILEQINGIISTGKEAVILHANSDPSYTGSDNGTSGQKGGAGVGGSALPQILPKECAIKIFKTTLNEFKQRDRYIKDDYRFKDRFSKQNNRVVINMWAEKEMHNMMRMQNVGINCPDVVMLKKHILVMSFIGDNHNAAPKLKDARLNVAELSCAYEEIIAAMHKLYNEAKLVHADLSEYNILWYDDKCWFIDVAQSVEPEHPSALEFLMRDCGNIINFFRKRGLANIFSKEELFEHITSLSAEDHNVAMLERIYTRGASLKEATAPNQEQCPEELKPISYPFDLAWEKSQAERQKVKAKTPTTTEKSIDLENKNHTKISKTADAANNTANN